jgi:hypothetical protein
LIGGGPRRALAVVAVPAPAPATATSPVWTLLLALLALLAIAHTLSGRNEPPLEALQQQQQQQLQQQPRFACPLPSRAARDAARLGFARNLTRAHPWLLKRPHASRDAQDLFSAGLLEAHGFNAAEAAEFAQMALSRQPRCAACAWLGAHALGPTPNVVADARGSRGAGFPVFGPEEAAQADALAQKALALALEEEQEEEKAAAPIALRLIRALADRNRGAAALVAEATSGEPLPEPWRPRQEAYARELASLAAEVEREEAEEEGDDEGGAFSRADVLALAAEAHLCLTPWDYYYYYDIKASSKTPPHPPRRLLLRGSDFWARFALSSSSPASDNASDSAAVPNPNRQLRLRPTAATAERLLRSALRLDPRHPLALHLLVHVAEAGTPGPRPPRLEDEDKGAAATAVAAWRGEAAADALASLRYPQGHLIHMPSHVYVRLGRYRDALRSNAAARHHDVSVAARSRCAPAYVPEHNAQLASYAAAAAGMERAALGSALGARRLRASLPDLYVARGTEWATVPLLRARFGDWRAVLLPEGPRSGVVAAAADGVDKEEEDSRVGAPEDVPGEEKAKPDPDFARGPLLPPPLDARARTLAGGPGFAKVVYHYVRLLALAARAEAERVNGVDGSATSLTTPSLELQVARELRALRRAAADRHALREPRTLPGGSPGLYASGNAFIAPIYERIGTARAEMVQAARWRAQEEREQQAGSPPPPPQGWRRRKRHQRRQRQRQRLAAAAERRALAALREAVELERGLPYFEPPMLEAPASVCLGWLLLRARGGGGGTPEEEEAARVFRRELAERHPENPWALVGLLSALERRKDKSADQEAEFANVRRRAERAWRHADASVRERFGPGSGGTSSSCPQLSAPWPAKKTGD